jgi:NitT/TauT family transport system ATP-binding protein
LIEARSVSFSYRRADGGAVLILHEFDMTIGAGECFCLVGPSGCGKSTALALIAGFQFPDTGIVRVEGRDVSGPGAERAVVFQGEDSLFDWLNVLENVAFGLKLRGVGKAVRTEVARKFLQLIGLTRYDEKKYPHELSGGMKQRVQIARVLANEPKVLLMDEPFGAVDAQTRAELQEELLAIWTRTHKTMLFITHDIGEAILLGDRIGVMRSGGPGGSNVREIIPVTLPRPRNHATPGFGALYEQIYGLVKEEVAASRRVHAGGE